MLPFQAETYNLNFYLPCFVKPLHSFSPLSLLHCLLETHHLPQFAFGLGCNTLTCPIALQDKSQVLTKYFQHKSCAHPGQNWTSQSVTRSYMPQTQQGSGLRHPQHYMRCWHCWLLACSEQHCFVVVWTLWLRTSQENIGHILIKTELFPI
jgi:hypothetical protein